ncbi:hypothetical protein [Myxococcus sp. NMCA1]|uniref:hypothetical protein n=1 Tax=Myxococcus sp. NMCA1 TaxID=2996785 RepID=UPI0022858198|nr:hypothetical protein [Myxococcus sp. NMCA1]WAM23849.1 hypothetical protein OZ403_25240 [Myxococcus sp. NMCA1]
MSCSRIEFTVPTGTVNPTNTREHHHARARRVRDEREETEEAWPGWTAPALLVVRLTRVSPRLLDGGDNLPAALKPVRDEVARQLRLDDASPLVRWDYEQVQGPAAVVVEMAWGDDPLAVAIRAKDAVQPPPPPVPLLTVAKARTAARAKKERQAPAPGKAAPAKSWAQLATPNVHRSRP